MDPKHRPWTLEDECVVRKDYPSLGAALLADRLGRTASSVKSKARKLNVFVGSERLNEILKKALSMKPPVSEATREKLRIIGKNRPPPSEESRRRMSVASSGRRHSVDARKKISDAVRSHWQGNDERRKSQAQRMAGKPIAVESRERMSRAKRGKSNGRKGVPLDKDLISKRQATRKLNLSNQRKSGLFIEMARLSDFVTSKRE